MPRSFPGLAPRGCRSRSSWCSRRVHAPSSPSRSVVAQSWRSSPPMTRASPAKPSTFMPIWTGPSSSILRAARCSRRRIHQRGRFMAKPNASRAIKLLGTESPDPKSRILRAGAMSAEFGNGALRYIRVNEVEVLRAIAFLVRDENWGTYAPAISNLKVKHGREGFSVSYDARYSSPRGNLDCRAEISASADGRLRFGAKATPNAGFLTNRTGFVVLHPLNGVAGFPVDVEHVDGKREKSKFPVIINPVQPFYAIRSLRHKVMPGLFVTCRMEGDTFEMEDHRNWTDASFKTYVRPLADPWPYTLPAGKEFSQSVTLTFEGKLPKPKKAGAAGNRVDIELGRTAGPLPEIGVAVPMEEAGPALRAASLVEAAAPGHLVCHVDAREGDIASALSNYRRLGEATSADIVLE